MHVARSLPLPALLATLGGCVAASTAPSSIAAPAPVFDPIAFFAGTTHGTGRLHVILHRTRSTDVVGIGTVAGQDAIVLRQRVAIDGEKPTNREWRLRRTGPGTYTGTLTDATAPVAATVEGNALTIRFPMKHGLAITQHLYLQPGGAVALNTMVVRKWGVVVARLDERIEKQQ